MKCGKDMKSKIDSEIIDLIMTHFNLLAVSGVAKDKQVLTTDDFDDLVKLAEKMYYERILHNTPVGVEGEA
jgi:septum formation inhibitor-activating ATPase MinD